MTSQLKASTSKTVDEKTVSNKKGKPNMWNRRLNQLVSLCKENNVSEVKFIAGADDCYDPSTMTIVINERRTDEFKFYVLLHEYGHHCIWVDAELREKFRTSASFKPPKTLSGQVLALEEELMAWLIGEETSRVHKMPIDKKSFQQLKSVCIKAHVGILNCITAKKKLHKDYRYKVKGERLLYSVT